MFIYNVTVTVDKDIRQEWLEWMKGVHIPDVMRTGLFTESKICRLLTDEDEYTFAVQYTFKSMNDLDQYRKDFAPKLQKEHSDKFKDKFAAFRTVLEIM